MKTRKLKVSLFILFLIALLVTIITPVKAITWGQPDEVHTNVGAILIQFIGENEQEIWLPMCSGTLIDDRVFLTAGHCTYGLVETYGLDRIRVTFDQDASEPDTLLEVDQVIPHPYYGGGQSNPHDVGVLILKEDAPAGITPAILPEEGLLDELKKEGELRQGSDGADFTVVGYGGTLNWPPPDIVYEDCRQSAVSEYQALLKSWLRLSQNEATGDGGTSYGDSGGPAFWTDPDSGDEILVGITSWGDAQTVATGFYYRTDTADTLDFVNPIIEGLQD